MTMLTQADLQQFTGTRQYYKHGLGFHYTDGVQFLAEQGEAYWLLDAIASHQYKLLKNPQLQAFQLWLLVVGNDHPFLRPKAGHQAVLTGWPDQPKREVPPLIRQDILYTDFPLPQVKLYWEHGVLLLPSEH